MRLLLPVVLLLAACGQTGPLVLPEQTPEPLSPPSAQDDRESPQRREPAPTAASPAKQAPTSPSTDNP